MEGRQWSSIDMVVYWWKLHGGMHAWFAGLTLRNIVLRRVVSCVVEPTRSPYVPSPLLNPSPTLAYGCGAVLTQPLLWLQLDKRPPMSFGVRASCGLGGRRFYHVRRLLVSALLYTSLSYFCVLELPKGLLGGGG